MQLYGHSIPFVNLTMVWNNPPLLPRHVTTLSSTVRRYTHSRGETVTVSSKFRGNGTHGECVGHNATIRKWETTWTALRRQHLLRPFSNLMRWNIDDLFGNTSRTVLLWNDLQDSKVKYINQRHKGTSEKFCHRCVAECAPAARTGSPQTFFRNLPNISRKTSTSM